MNTYSLFQLSDQALTAGLGAAVARERENTALLLAHIAEFDARHLFAPAGYSCMHGYCVGVLGLSEDGAMKRLQAARAARRFPVIFDLVARGRLHLSAVCLLAPRLTHDNAAELLAAAAGRTKAGIETLLAARFPRADVPARVLPLRAESTACLPAPGQVDRANALGGNEGIASAVVPESDGAQDPPAPAPRPRVAPLAPERYAIQFTAGGNTHDLLRYAEDLLGHRLDSSEMDQIFAAGLAALIAKLENSKFAATDRPRPQNQPARGRHVPAAIRREVWTRDQGRCTFVSESGRRCDARRYLEYDHIEPVARGGKTTAGNLRLRCRAHNQYEAGRAFGAGFMHALREGRRAGAGARSRSAAGP